MKIYIIILIGFFFSLNIFSQEKYWESSLQWATTQNGFKIFAINDSSYITFGSTKNGLGSNWQGFSALSTYSVLNSNEHIYLDTLQSGARDVIQEDSTFLLVTEVYYSPTVYERIFMVRTNLLGQPIFSTVIESEFRTHPKTLEKTNDGNYLIGGYIVPDNTPPYDWELYLIKVDSLGNVLWEQTYLEEEYLGDATFTDIYPLENGNYLLKGIIEFNFGPGSIILMEVTEDGTLLWEQTYEFSYEDKPIHIYKGNDGGFILNIISKDWLSGLQLGSILKLDDEYEVEWLLEDLFEICSASKILSVDNDSAYVIAGCINTLTDYGAQTYIVKINNSGDILWKRQYGGLGHDYGYDMIAAPDGGYIISGRTESFAEDTASIYLVKVNCMGLLTEPEAQFSYEQSDFSFDFLNESQYVYPDSIDGGHYFWNFGDGGSSEELNPTHTYPEIGIYGASLTGIVCNDTSTYRQILCVGEEATSTPNFSVNSDDGSLHYFENESILPNNFSLDFAHYTWDFGDGNISSAIHPIHHYTNAGVYIVTLTYTICEQVYEYSTEIDVSTSTELLTEKTKVSIYPNPAQEQAIITYDLGDFKSAALHLYDTQGRLVQVQSLDVGAAFTSINLSRLISGLYVYEVVVDGERVGGGSLVVGP